MPTRKDPLLRTSGRGITQDGTVPCCHPERSRGVYSNRYLRGETRCGLTTYSCADMLTALCSKTANRASLLPRPTASSNPFSASPDPTAVKRPNVPKPQARRPSSAHSSTPRQHSYEDPCSPKQ